MVDSSAAQSLVGELDFLVGDFAEQLGVGEDLDFLELGEPAAEGSVAREGRGLVVVEGLVEALFAVFVVVVVEASEALPLAEEMRAGEDGGEVLGREGLHVEEHI